MSCKRCSKPAWVDDHRVCAECQRIMSHLRIMGKPNPCGEVPLAKPAGLTIPLPPIDPKCSRCRDTGQVAHKPGKGSYTIQHPCSCAAGDEQKIAFFDQPLDPPSGTHAGSGSLSGVFLQHKEYYVDEINAGLQRDSLFVRSTAIFKGVGIEDPKKTTLTADMLIEAKEKIQKSMGIPASILPVTPTTYTVDSAEYTKSSCYGCGVSVSFTTSYEPDMCSPCEERYWELDGDVQNGFNRPITIIGDQIPCYRHGCNNDSDLFSSGTAACHSCYEDYEKCETPLNFEGWCHLHNNSKPDESENGVEKFFSFEELCWPPKYNDHIQSFHHDGIDYKVNHMLGDGVLAIQTETHSDDSKIEDLIVSEDKYPYGSKFYTDEVLAKMNIASTTPKGTVVARDGCQYKIILSCINGLWMCKVKDSDSGVEDSVTWFQRISRESV